MFKGRDGGERRTLGGCAQECPLARIDGGSVPDAGADSVGLHGDTVLEGYFLRY